MPRLARHPSTRITLYNHKGGVGKTTLTINIAAALAALGKKVLLVDTDPQCNLTSYLVESRVIDSLLDNSENERGRTIWSGLKPLVDGTGPVKKIQPFERLNNIFLIPGDIRLSKFEEELTDLWTDCLQRKTRGYNGVTAISDIVNSAAFSRNVDYIFYDVGPNIGPLNRVLLMDSDFFIIPAACDLFSIRALKTLGQALKSWILDCEVIAKLAPDNTLLLRGVPKFMGYILQRFKIYGGVPTSNFISYVPKIEKSIQSDIIHVLKSVNPALSKFTTAQHRLGQIKDFTTLASESQEQGRPFFDLAKGDPAQMQKAKHDFNSIAKNIIALTGK